METRAEFPLPDVAWEPTREFWSAAARDELRLPRCASCAAFAWYPGERCRSCGGAQLAWERLSGRATLFSWVVVRHPFLPQFRENLPLVTGLVAVDEDPRVRLPTRIVECTPEELAIDMPVEVVFRDLTFPGVAGHVRAPLFRPLAAR
ncbi:MAG: nucleic acid-binding protein [Deltaproteobacteria bacterium]|nr:nucleic acid-binding protein [Deltaproteobacteria bacterium]